MRFNKTIPLKLRSLYALACGLGALSVLALAPVDFYLALGIGFSGFAVLFCLPQMQDKWRSFFLGWWYGLGFFTAGLYWIVLSLGVEIEKFFWLIPFALLGLPAVFALFTAGATLLASRLRGRPLIQLTALVLSWCLAEVVRGQVILGGFPWNLVGYSLVPYTSLLQSASWFGAYGLSLVALFVAILPAIWLLETRKVALYSTATILVLVLSLHGEGERRLKEAGARITPGVVLRLVQPNIPQKQKWQRHLADEHFIKTVRLSQAVGVERVTHIIWPETAIQFDPHHDRERLSYMTQVIPRNGALLTGAPRWEGGQDGDHPFAAWNSLLAIDPKARIVAVFDKFHLVPFGEYVPGRAYLPSWIHKITAGGVDFTPGPGIKTLQVEGLPPFSPLVCYEGIFPGEVALKGDQRPAWLLNITNDGWFGVSSGPYQHLAMTRVRAVEEGLPLVRVANTGVSCLIDPYGRILASIPLEQEGVLDVALPQPLGATPFARHGHAVFMALWSLMALALLGFRFLAAKAVNRREP
ncbi:MAG: apolipoprotein N-acyltransferase [Holosporales bacterium]